MSQAVSSKTQLSSGSPSQALSFPGRQAQPERHTVQALNSANSDCISDGTVWEKATEIAGTGSASLARGIHTQWRRQSKYQDSRG